ncbi:MAG TPA: helix-turn-helix domain-containing protein [Desulfitobacterium dehalogenans]|uniref:Helix-turn-helix domain-containing protein n=1 Tax=Desulfitobacterium dehalogenans TaxID=36854 RepID=A0A7C6Z3P9_9FIRM|nr:helix-turn-helix domain-containing protein [Desulfitobacterium dehalogenans]
MIQKATLSSKEAAEYLGISYWLLLEMVKREEINPIRAGGRYLFRQSGLDDWMTRQEEQGRVEHLKLSPAK